MNFNTNPFSSPVSKVLDSENGVVGLRGSWKDWALREGTAREGNGELKVAARAKDSSFERRMGFGFGISEVVSGIWRQREVLVVVEGLEEVEGSGGRRWPIKFMICESLLSFQNTSHFGFILCPPRTVPFSWLYFRAAIVIHCVLTQ